MSRRLATILGLFGLLFWSTTIAVPRAVTESWGLFGGAAAVSVLGGVIGLVVVVVRGRLGEIRRLTIRYLLVCGTCFLAYNLALYVMLGIAASRQQVTELGVVNYLWPGLTLVLSVPLLRLRARWTLLSGIVVAFLGVVVVNGASFGQMIGNMRANGLAYMCAFCCAVSWAIYSNMNRKWRDETGEATVPMLLLGSGLIFLVIRLFRPEDMNLSVRSFVEVAYVAVFPLLLSLTFWDLGMRYGNATLLAALAYGVPILSAIVSCLYLGLPFTWGLFVASGLVVVGALVCKLSITDDHQ